MKILANCMEGALLGVYATSNGENEGFNAYVSNWSYVGKEQVVGN